MSGITYEYMESYLRGLIRDSDGHLKDMEEYSKENHVPIIQKEIGNYLRTMLGITKPKKILELGTAIGYSAILMCDALNKDVNITTIERSDEMVKLANSNIEKYGYEDNIKVIHNECEEALRELSQNEEGMYDLIFMDAGKGHYNHFLPYCLKLMKKDGIIIADNVLFKGMVASDELVKRRKITIVKRMRTYLEMVSNDDDLQTTVIPMGDGIALTIRR